MSTSSERKILKKEALRGLCFAVFLVAFNLVYGIFAHGVRSIYMQTAFVIPLVGGSLVSLLLFFLPYPNAIVKAVWPMGLATLSVGFLLHGVFDIYGTEEELVNVFFYAGVILLSITGILYIIQLVQSRNKKSKPHP